MYDKDLRMPWQWWRLAMFVSVALAGTCLVLQIWLPASAWRVNAILTPRPGHASSDTMVFSSYHWATGFETTQWWAPLVLMALACAWAMDRERSHLSEHSKVPLALLLGLAAWGGYQWALDYLRYAGVRGTLSEMPRGHYDSQTMALGPTLFLLSLLPYAISAVIAARTKPVFGGRGTQS